MTRHLSIRRDVAVLAAFLAVVLTFMVIVLRAGGTDIVPTSRYELQAVLPDVVSLAPGAEVRMAGVEVGRVEDIRIRGAEALVKFWVADDEAPVYRDARLRIGLKSLVGESYLQLDGGTPRSGPLHSGALLSRTSEDEATQLDQILSTLDPRTRRRLQRSLEGLSASLSGPAGGDLNDTLDATSTAVDGTRPVAAALRAQRREVAALVDDGGRVLRALGDRAEAIQVLARGIAQTTKAVARRDGRLRATLAELPATLRQVQTTARRLQQFSPRATPVVRDLASATTRLVPVVRELSPTATATRAAVDELARFAPPGRTLLRRLRSVATLTVTALPSLDRSVAELNPALRYVVPYARDITAFFSNLRSASNLVDATGNVARIFGIVSDSSLSGVLTAEQQRALDALLSSGALGKVGKRGNNAYPEPGESAAPRPLSRTYPQVDADPLADPRHQAP